MKLSIVATALMIAGAFAAPAAVPEASPNDIEARTLKIFDFNWCLKEKAAYILCQKSELKWIWDYNQCKKGKRISFQPRNGKLYREQDPANDGSKMPTDPRAFSTLASAKRITSRTTTTTA